MFGTTTDQKFKAKAAETAGVRGFVLQLITRFGDVIPNAQRNIAVGECLVTYLRIMKTSKRKLTTSEYQD